MASLSPRYPKKGQNQQTLNELKRKREVVGKFLLSDASTHLLEFSMEKRLPPNSELVQAVLRLFQEPVPKAALRRPGLSPRHAQTRVTIEWLRVREDGSNRTSLIDSRLVSLHESGWKTLLLLVSVHREHLVPGASSAHKLVRFAPQGEPGGVQDEPQLELHTLDLKDYGAQGSCDPEVPLTEGTRCCRREMFVDLQGMKWAENWILEPPGFVAHECVGSCWQLPEPLSFKWPFLGPRRCIASEMAALPMIVSIQEGGRIRPRVVSLPNMRVKQCSCAQWP
ncbi:left-right determination factor 2-like [Lepus europaeus]|uniref:left-right determination factor 2-like n=1 Tax=Lepus europaeus TaxID=9983 RepID=UPI002B47C9C7|nr:left-right determination factor 2-like [Lepus europaeus]